MKFVVLLMKVHLKSAYSALRNDTRTKIAFFISFSLSCGIGLWPISQLLVYISQWYATGSALLEVHLWLLYVGAWIGIGPFAALSTRTLGFGVINQSRNVFTWGRLVIVLVCIALFPLIRTFLIPFGFSNMLLAVMYASGVTILAMIDYAPYAISSEGSRLIFYLVAQTGITMYLRSRLIVLLIAALLVGLTLSLVLSWWIGLSADSSAILVGLEVASFSINVCVTIVNWGSANFGMAIWR
jgi:hypothetical protein